MLATTMVHVVAGKGVHEDPRYFDRVHPATGEPNRRQVTLIEREQIQEHAAALGLGDIAPGAVRANVETVGIRLGDWLGQQLLIGEAVVLLHAPRQPCAKMDAVCAGLRALMAEGRQGVLAEVLRSGTIEVGDTLRPFSSGQS
jgi:MOSC domain-containing protein YiiM